VGHLKGYVWKQVEAVPISSLTRKVAGIAAQGSGSDS
jgi:hypothetical protein